MLNDFLAEFAPLLIQGTLDTLVRVFASTAVAYVIGTVLGVSCCTSPRRTVCAPCPC